MYLTNHIRDGKVLTTDPFKREGKALSCSSNLETERERTLNVKLQMRGRNMNHFSAGHGLPFS